MHKEVMELKRDQKMSTYTMLKTCKTDLCHVNVMLHLFLTVCEISLLPPNIFLNIIFACTLACHFLIDMLMQNNSEI